MGQTKSWDLIKLRSKVKKVRSKDIWNDEKLDLSGNEKKKKSKMLTNWLGKNWSHPLSTAPQDLQYRKLWEFLYSV